MTAVSLDGGSLISALWKGRRFDLEGRSLGNHLTWPPHFRDGDMRSRDAWCFTQSHTASRCHGSRFTHLFWLSVKSSITCTTRGWMAPLYTVGKLLTRWPQIVRCSASFDFVTPARVRTRGIQVDGSRKVLKLFTSVTSSLNGADEEELPLILLRALRAFTCSMRIWRRSPLVLPLYDYVQGLCVVAIQLWDPWSLTLGLSSEGVLTWLTYFPM